MKIAIIGSGISGLVCAHLLYKDFDISLFEANDYVGGHTHTIDVSRPDGAYSIDTGFIVFNRVTYPNFSLLLDKLEVPSQPTCMNFSVRCEETGLEYGSRSFDTMFAQRSNLLSFSFWRMIFEIFKLRRYLVDYIVSNRPDMSMGRLLAQYGYSRRFIDHFVIPLGASLWSAEPGKICDFPARTFGRFFNNHGFLRVTNPIQWRVVTGGSNQYVKKLTRPFARRIYLSAPVTKIERQNEHVRVSFANKEAECFDQVIVATHSDQALKLLENPTENERKVLGSIPYQKNDAALHTDASVLPLRRKAWASWNYLIQKGLEDRASVTYNMNMLQTIQSGETFCVSLNSEERIDEDKILGKYVYHHPVYTDRSISAQASHSLISGQNRTHYCGAYWGYGFHEDGVKSALAVGKYFGKSL